MGNNIGVGAVTLTSAQNRVLQNALVKSGVTATSTVAEIKAAAAAITQAGTSVGLSGAVLTEAVAATFAGAGISGAAAAAAISAGIVSVVGATAVGIATIAGGTLAVLGAAATIAVVNNNDNTKASP